MNGKIMVKSDKALAVYLRLAAEKAEAASQQLSGAVELSRNNAQLALANRAVLKQRAVH